jgi:hypothetical protein
LQSAQILDLEHQRVFESAAQMRRLRALTGGRTDPDRPGF